MPRWLVGKGRGWLTAEYSMLPASTGQRTAARGERRQAEGAHRRDPAPDRPRASRRRRPGGARRADALDRLRRHPGRRRHALRRDLGRLCRCEARARPLGPREALTTPSAPSRVGIVEGEPVLDLDYVEDSSAEVDVNVVMAGDGRLIEVQATAERAPLDRDQLDELLDLAAAGIEEIGVAQKDAVEAVRALSCAGRRCCSASCSPGCSAARSASSARSGSARPACGRTCSSPSAPRSSRSSPPTASATSTSRTRAGSPTTRRASRRRS